MILKKFTLCGLLGALLLSGCSAVHTSVAKKQLDVQTKMSQTIFLDPVAADKRIVYVQVRNTSDKPGLQLEPAIKQGIINNGYRITDNPEEAQYWLQANVLKAGRADKKFDGSEADSALTGAAIGSTLGDGDGKIASAVAGALLASVIDASVQDIYYTIITDIRISERTQAGTTVTESEQSHLQQGDSGEKQQSSVAQVGWKRYQTHIVSVANKVNLQYPEAEQPLVDGLVQSIANIF